MFRTVFADFKVEMGDSARAVIPLSMQAGRAMGLSLGHCFGSVGRAKVTARRFSGSWIAVVVSFPFRVAAAVIDAIRR